MPVGQCVTKLPRTDTSRAVIRIPRPNGRGEKEIQKEWPIPNVTKLLDYIGGQKIRSYNKLLQLSAHTDDIAVVFGRNFNEPQPKEQVVKEFWQHRPLGTQSLQIWAKRKNWSNGITFEITIETRILRSVEKLFQNERTRHGEVT